MIMKPNHPLSHKSGYVYEHRYVLHKDIGDSLSCCELCGESVTWKSVHVDHIDRDVTNNKRDNLRPLCRVCNTRRDRLEACLDKNNKAITWFGETKTPEEWGRDSRVPVKGHTIRQRLRRGLSVKESLFMEKKTHNKLTA